MFVPQDTDQQKASKKQLEYRQSGTSQCHKVNYKVNSGRLCNK